MNRKKIFLFVGGLIFVISGLVFLSLPVDLQKKIFRKLSIPYQELYLSLTDVDSMVSAPRASAAQFYNNGMQHGANAYIAHGGGIGPFVYSNSVEAVADSVNRGFRFLEIDLHETSDGNLVGIHDWESFAKRTGHQDARLSGFRKLPTDELKKLKIDDKYTVISSEDICELMQQNPHLILVTDKIDNFDILVKRIPFPERMIVEVFSSYDYVKALEAGIKYPAFSILKKRWIDELEEYKFPLAVAPAYWFDDPGFVERVSKLHRSGVVFLVYGAPFCDSPNFIQRHLGKDISLIYTDKWYPNGPHPLQYNDH